MKRKINFRLFSVLFIAIVIGFGTTSCGPKVKAFKTEEGISYKIYDYGEINVDYSMTFNQMVEAGEYQSIEDEFENGDLKIQLDYQETVEQRFALFKFKNDATHKNIAKTMNLTGYRPATVEELLAFGIIHKKPFNYPIIAIETTIREKNGKYYAVPLIDDGRGKERILDLNYVSSSDMQWCDFCRFLAVKGEPITPIEQEFNPRVTIEDIGTITVNYDMNFDDMVAFGSYSSKHANFTSEELPFKSKQFEKGGEIDYEAVLISFKDAGYYQDSRIPLEIKENGYRPATIEELLSFGMEHPEYLGYEVAACGSKTENSVLCWCSCSLTTEGIPVIDGRTTSKKLELYSELVEDWRPSCKFLAIKEL